MEAGDGGVSDGEVGEGGRECGVRFEKKKIKAVSQFQFVLRDNGEARQMLTAGGKNSDGSPILCAALWTFIFICEQNFLCSSCQSVSNLSPYVGQKSITKCFFCSSPAWNIMHEG